MLLPEDGVNLLPFICLPLMGSESYSDEVIQVPASFSDLLTDIQDTDGMPEDLQLLPPDKARDTDNDIIITHLESLLLLTTTRFGRDYLREKKLYPIVRETHLAIAKENVEDACDRVVQVCLSTNWVLGWN